MDDLVDQLLLEILFRLRTSKCATRCKAVCKRWHDLISNDYFINQFISQHCGLIPPCPSITLVFEPQTQLLMIPSNDPNSETGLDGIGFLDSLLPDLVTRVAPDKEPKVRIMGVYNDLFLCFKWSDNHINYKRDYVFYICNPQTKVWVELPGPLISSPPNIQAALVCRQPYRFSNNATIDDGRCSYRVVVFEPPQISNTSEFTGHIFSSESGKWDEVVLASPKSFQCWLNEGDSLVNDNMVYFYDMEREGMIAFDPFSTHGKKNANANVVVDCHYVDWPQDPRPPNTDIVVRAKIGVCQGRLRMCRATIDANSLWIWDLMDYHTSNWSLQYNVMLRDLSGPTPINFYGLDIVGPHPLCGDYVYLEFESQIVLCDLKRRRLKAFFTDLKDFDTYGDFRAFFLLPQWWPTPLTKCKKVKW